MRVQTSADYSSIESISERLIEASNSLGNMAERVAKARQIRDYDGDRRKRALSCAVNDLLKTSDSATAAEHKARASESYAENMKALAASLTAAESVISEWEAAKIKWETARSLLSVQKSLVANL
jgi:hypothetical protein